MKTTSTSIHSYTRFRLPAILVALATVGMSPLAQAAITGFDIKFNTTTASSYTDNFKRASDDINMAGLAWSATGGTGGGGGLTVSEQSARNLFYRPTPASNDTSTFDIKNLAAGETFASAIDFKWANTTATTTAVITAGFVPNNTSQGALTSAGALAGSIIRSGNTTVTLRMRNGTTNATSLEFNQTALTAGNWYRLTYDLTKTDVTNFFNYTVSLYSIGASGTATPVLFNDGTKNITISGSVSNSAIYTDPDAFFAYDIRGDTTGISHVDNLVVSGVVIPEPAHAAIVLLLAAVGAVIARRQHKA